MNDLDRRIGYWSILTLTVAGYLYALSYVVVAAMFPVRLWVDIQDFAAYYTGAYKVFFTATQILAWLLSLAFAFVGVVIFRRTQDSKKMLSILGLLFSTVFLTLSSMHYYIQWTTVNTSLASGKLEGLDMFVQANFDSPISTANIFGWTFFFGAANILYAFCFGETRREKLIKFGLLSSGFASVLAALLFALNFKIVMLFWTIVLVVTWYVYPVMLTYYRTPKSGQSF